MPELAGKSPQEITDWAVRQGAGKAIVTTNFRPYEAVILHMAALAERDIPGARGRSRHESARDLPVRREVPEFLGLNLKPYLPLMTSAHWLAINGGAVPMPDEVERVESFSRIMKLEPFERGMRELAAAVWITALRKEQNPQRAASLQTVMWDAKFNTLKVNPILDWTPTEMEAYLAEHALPNERTDYDPAEATRSMSAACMRSS